jgi:hypothetical protein
MVVEQVVITALSLRENFLDLRQLGRGHYWISAVRCLAYRSNDLPLGRRHHILPAIHVLNQLEDFRLVGFQAQPRQMIRIGAHSPCKRVNLLDWQTGLAAQDHRQNVRSFEATSLGDDCPGFTGHVRELCQVFGQLLLLFFFSKTHTVPPYS